MSVYERAEELLVALDGRVTRLERLTVIRDALAEGERWRRVAVYLADCHAASGESDGRRRSTSQSAAMRLANICDTAAKMLRGEYVEGRHSRDTNDVLARLERAASGIRVALESRMARKVSS